MTLDIEFRCRDDDEISGDFGFGEERLIVDIAVKELQESAIICLNKSGDRLCLVLRCFCAHCYEQRIKSLRLSTLLSVSCKVFKGWVLVGYFAVTIEQLQRFVRNFLSRMHDWVKNVPGVLRRWYWWPSLLRYRYKGLLGVNSTYQSANSSQGEKLARGYDQWHQTPEASTSNFRWRGCGQWHFSFRRHAASLAVACSRVRSPRISWGYGEKCSGCINEFERNVIHFSWRKRILTWCGAVERNQRRASAPHISR